MAFDQWLAKVLEYQAQIRRKDPHDLYPYIDMTDAKFSFIDGVAPEQYIMDEIQYT